MKFIQFNDKKIDSFLFMQLSDLAKTLAKQDNLVVEFGFRSYYDPIDSKIILSHFWDNRSFEERVHGLKTDVFLRSVGSKKYTDYQSVSKFIDFTKKTSLPSFAKQLFMIAEDLRLEELCKKDRPGTLIPFKTRNKVYRKYFKDQLNVNLVKSVQTDALFNSIFILLTSTSPLEEIPSIKKEIDSLFPFLRSELTKYYETTSTNDVIKLTAGIIEVLEEVLENDMLNIYFHLPELEYDELFSQNFDDLKRKNKLKNDDSLDDVKKGDEDVHDDVLPTWHQETSTPTKSFLQFDLEQGTQTNLLGESAREGDAGDQALGIVQGSSKKSKRSDFSKVEALEVQHDPLEGKGQEQYGKENKFAKPIMIDARIPKSHEIEQYFEHKAKIAPYQKKLKQMIMKTLEHKKIQPRGNLHFGRLSKKLLPLLTDENPRLFYKKNETSPEIDAVFTLLVDCSASMHDKMEQTKLGITLFHEALKAVRVPHKITGFWEDTNDATETYQPNYFHHSIDFHTSLQAKTGPEIMQLQPEEDNRDGFSIRLMTEELVKKRSEKQKFLLVFSDGEPAAFSYEQNGIVDTHEAVLEARKQGIEVMNVFLANGEIDEGQKNTIQNIYGKYSILVKNIDELPDILFPLLKKLLLKSL
ncbi:vWA domain-containing protein [Litchfieldia alkalitelluris]|uniref:vWA domain-containing protein n=1 Tax=Litchfieldia alkalitelluris TaxID=304268 RepID=UPI000997E825|nr:VWA domain-containing protein [Litchfieldia alkalitelluris]